MRPLDDLPPAAAEWAGRKPYKGDMYKLEKLIESIEVEGKKVEEERHWAMLQAKKRSRLEQQNIRVQHQYIYDEEWPTIFREPPPIPRLINHKISDICFCGAKATYFIRDQWVCINHINP